MVNGLLSIYTYSNALTRAMLFFKTMEIRFPDMVPNRTTYELLMSCALQSKKLKESVYLFELWKQKGFKTKAHHFREMVQLCAYHKEPEMVANYLKRMKEEGLTVRDKDRAHLATVIGLVSWS